MKISTAIQNIAKRPDLCRECLELAEDLVHHRHLALAGLTYQQRLELAEDLVRHVVTRGQRLQLVADVELGLMALMARRG